MKISFLYQNDSYRIIDEEKTIDWIKRVITKEEKRLGEIEYYFVTEEEILRINQEFLDHNYLTDIITFDNSFVNIINGNIFISPDTVQSNAHNFKTSLQNELYRVVIHGIMHLCGYEDRTEIDQNVMRSKENEYLAYLEEL